MLYFLSVVPQHWINRTHGKCLLYAGWVQHDTDLSTDSLRGKVSTEPAPDDTVRTMSPADLAPVDTELVTVLVRCLALGDECDTLSEVEIDLLLRIDALDLYETDIVVLVAESTLVTEDGSVDVKAGWSGG